MAKRSKRAKIRRSRKRQPRRGKPLVYSIYDWTLGKTVWVRSKCLGRFATSATWFRVLQLAGLAAKLT